MELPVKVEFQYCDQSLGSYNLWDGAQNVNVTLDRPEGILRVILTQHGGSSSSKDIGTSLGCISFQTSELIQGIRQNTQFQASKIWITLFESADDDLYDGDFGEDDLERPRILLNYKLSTTSSDASGLKKPTTVTKQIRQTKQNRQLTKQTAPIPEPKPQHNFVPSRAQIPQPIPQTQTIVKTTTTIVKKQVVSPEKTDLDFEMTNIERFRV